MARTYNFTLPYTIDKATVYWGYFKLESQGIFQALPSDLQQQFIDARNNGQPVTVTQDDLDEIDDDTWTKLASELGLQWSNS